MHMKEALQEVIKEVPFNNFTPILEVYGRTFPEALGGNCIYLVSRLVAKINERVLGSSSFLMDRETEHHATMVEIPTGQRFFLDPYLMQQEPLDLGDAILNGRTVTSAAWPEGEKFIHRVSLTPGSNGRFKITKETKSRGAGVWEPVVEDYEYDPSQAISTLSAPPKISSAALLNPRKLVLKVFTGQSEVSMIRSVTDPDRSVRFKSFGKLEKDPQGAIEKATGNSREAIIDLMEETIGLLNSTK